VKVRRIVQNLVLNALKHTDQGSVTVSWSDSAPDDPKRWVLSVKDTGPGLPDSRSAPLTGALEQSVESAESVASPDEDLPSSRRPDQAGEGIGLSIVKRLAELLDAAVEVHTDVAAGTTFRVLLPRRYAPDQPAESAPPD
jgi:signal transduction histidine kinase